MYVPPSFREAEPGVAFDLVEEIRLGTLISAGRGIAASHLPFLVERASGAMGRLVGHCARPNPQWRGLRDAEEVLVTFLGPSTHVSPSWYRSHPRAPTWLYVAVHLRGRIFLTEDPAMLRDIVTRFSDVMEPAGSPWRLSDTGNYVSRLLPGIVGFHIDVERIDTQLRLAQQNDQADRNGVYDALNAGNLRMRGVAELMRRYGIARGADDD